MAFKNYAFKMWHGAAAGAALYLAANLSADFREAKDVTFDNLKTQICQTTDGAVYSSTCEALNFAPN